LDQRDEILDLGYVGGGFLGDLGGGEEIMDGDRHFDALGFDDGEGGGFLLFEGADGADADFGLGELADDFLVGGDNDFELRQQGFPAGDFDGFDLGDLRRGEGDAGEGGEIAEFDQQFEYVGRDGGGLGGRGEAEGGEEGGGKQCGLDFHGVSLRERAYLRRSLRFWGIGFKSFYKSNEPAIR